MTTNSSEFFRNTESDTRFYGPIRDAYQAMKQLIPNASNPFVEDEPREVPPPHD